jgi:putative transposase
MHQQSFCLNWVHCVWATYLREPSISIEMDTELHSHLKEKCIQLGCRIYSVGNASDHVHLLFALRSTIALSDAVKNLKGYSSYQINCNPLQPSKFRWQAGYWVESVSPRDLDVVDQYISKQRTKHGPNSKAEDWETQLTLREKDNL